MTSSIATRILIAHQEESISGQWQQWLPKDYDHCFTTNSLLATRNIARINHPDFVVYPAEMAMNSDLISMADFVTELKDQGCCQLIVYIDGEDPDYGLVREGVDIIHLPSQQNLFTSRCRHLISEKHFQDMVENSMVGHIDPLSGLFNRRMLYDLGEKELNRCLRYNRPFSLILLKIVGFKSLNVTQGYRAGDALIHQLSKSILNHTRQSDLLARIGDTEFVLLLPECQLEQCKEKAARLLENLNQVHPEFDGEKLPIRLQIGTAEIDFGDLLIEQIIERASLDLSLAQEAAKD